MAAKKSKTKKVLGVQITRGDIPEDDWKVIHKFALALERGRFNEYIEILQNPKRLLWKSFIAGVGKGFGAVVGATVVVALLLALLALIGDVVPGDDPSERVKEKIEETTTR